MRALRSTTAVLAIACSSVRVEPPAPAAAEPRAAFRAYVDSVVGTPEFRSALWGVLIVDPVRGETLYTLNADKLFVPASNQKLITGAVALARLGADHRWSTTLLARGPIRNGVLLGDLVVRGEGDPSISSHMRGDAMAPLRELADSLRARGITRIRGRVTAAPSPFTDSPLGAGWEWDDLDEPYGAGVDALYFNEGFTEILVRAGARAGDAVRAGTRPAASHPPLLVRATTVARPQPGADSARRARLTVGYDSSRTALLVAGTIAAGDTAVLELALRDHPGAFVAALREALRSRGIAVEEARTDTSAALDSLVAMRSPPLRDVLPAFEKPSQNQIGELLFKSVALEVTGVGRADSAQKVVSAQLVAWGAEPDGFAVRDGSGLSRHNFVSPRTLVKVLDAMRRRPDFRVFYDALPVAGVDGTLDTRLRGTPAAGNVRAKTGYVDKARSLSGYVTAGDGRVLIFSLLCNNYSVPTRMVEQAQDALVIRLATLKLPGS
jgi:D-alanyl-D-alanine carboxypeptidase/D-alanyl-D-alanine-endopeptidase (penicillin-binding protein 4)